MERQLWRGKPTVVQDIIAFANDVSDLDGPGDRRPCDR
jgi:hypothetical protein